VIAEWLIKAGRRNAKKPLPTRGSLLAQFTLWSVIALMSALTIGMVIGKTLWHPPFSLWDVKNWTPIFLLVASLASAQTQLQRILDGSYQGGEADRNRLEPTQPIETRKSF
jgi:hypothetical protein